MWKYRKALTGARGYTGKKHERNTLTNGSRFVLCFGSIHGVPRPRIEEDDATPISFVSSSDLIDRFWSAEAAQLCIVLAG